MNLEAGLVNGLTGIITGFEDSLPILSLYGESYKNVKINKWTWAPDHPRFYLKRTQIPLIY